MEKFLTFALVAPMASFGDIAVGGRRDGFTRPARSAVLGLIAGCLGLTREKEEKHQTLSNSCGVALLCQAPGALLIDFHTAQMAPGTKKRTYATRAEELSTDPQDIATVLSRREYRMGSWHLGAIWLRDDTGPWTLENVQSAMRQPVFTPYLGRKSCPLGLPLAPEIIEADSVTAALSERQKNGREAELSIGYARRKEKEKTGCGITKPAALYRDQHIRETGYRSDGGGEVLVVMDAADIEMQGGEWVARHRIMRRDQPLSRRNWEFGLREEAVLSMPQQGGQL